MLNNESKKIKSLIILILILTTQSFLANAKVLIVTPKVYYANVVNGSFIVDGKNTKDSAGKTIVLSANDTIRIKPGKYSGGNITNIPAGVFIDAKDVEVIGTLKAGQYWTPIYIANSTGFTLSGLYLHDNNYMGISINGPLMDDVTFQNMRIDNINNYVFKFESNFNLPYDGTNNTVCNNIRFLNIEATRCSLLFSMPGALTSTGVVGLCRNIEVAYCYIHDAPDMGNVMWAGAAEDYNIHDNRVDKVNQNNNNHNGIFMMMGNGKFHHNYVSNHQGNAIRAWIFSVGKTPKTMEISDNLVYNSRQYSAFELQTPPWMADIIAAGKVTYCNTKVSNNTAINIKGIINGFDGVMIDLYNLSGGSTEYYNNLGANMYAQKGVTDMINMGNDKIIRKENNVYKASWQAAVVDTISFKSLFFGIGAATENVTTPTTIYLSTSAISMFLKNDCPVGYVAGDPVMYSIPVGKYISTISQLDADKKAQVDILANGQSYANINGACTLIPKPIDTIVATYIMNIYKSGAVELIKK